MITAASRGGKHTCSNCNSRFYDLNKTSIACPKCEFVVARVKPPLAPGRIDSKLARQQAGLRRLPAKRNHKAVTWKI